MPQINLLKQQKATSGDALQTIVSILVKLLAVVLIGVILYYGYIFYQIRAKNAEISKLNGEIQQVQKDLASIPGKEELYTRQQQLQQLVSLTSGHTYWSSLLPALAKVTLKSAHYVTISARQDGSISMSVTVPSTEELDKFLQIFDLSEFNQNFYNIKIGSLGKNQVDGQVMTQFDVNMQYNRGILQK